MSVKTTQFEADLDELANSVSSRRPVDPDVKRRIRERSQQIREDRFKKQGFLNVAVELIREIRDE
jgi:hypothetical protein